MFASLPVGAFGGVAVWKGAAIQTAHVPGVEPTAKAVVYVILDLETFVGRIVVATPESKQVYDEGERSYGFDVVPTAPKQTLFLTDAIESAPQNSAVEYTHQMVHLSGKLTTLFTGPNDTAPKLLPKLLKMLLSETVGAIFVTRGVVVQGMASYQAERTQAANSVSKTILQVSQDIRSELITGKGYTQINPP
jgi:hypothetical protein